MKIIILFDLTRRLVRGLRTRFRLVLFGMYSPRWYPYEIRLIHKLIKNDSNVNQTPIDLYSPLHKLRLSPKEAHNTSINLLGVDILLHDLPKIWDGSFQKDRVDSELLNASHRFHWILEVISESENSNQIKEILSILEEWNDWTNNKKSNIAYQPYNISERISNLTAFYFILINNELVGSKEISKMQDFINNELIILKDCLEYPASNIINNHVLNNARALMLGGFFIDNSCYRELSKEILKIHLPEMIDKNGYLKESSSHYQLLLTRSLIEISIISNLSSDDDFSQWVDSYSIRMFLASCRLEPQQEVYKPDFPNIGDVSPDIPSDWFSLSDNSPTGWNKLWNKPYFFSNKQIDISDDKSWVVLKRGDWFSLNFSHPYNRNYPDGHGHEDFGSFVLYFQGRQLIADIGRFTYDDVFESRVSGKESFSHSIVVLDDSKLQSRNNFCRRHGIVQDNIERNFKEQEGILNWETRARKYYWNRTLEINEKTIHIIDNIKAESAKSFFYLSPSCLVKAVNKNKVIVELHDVGSFEFEFKGMEQISVKEVDFFPGYGIKKKTFRLRCEISSKKELQKVETLITKI